MRNKNPSVQIDWCNCKANDILKRELGKGWTHEWLRSLGWFGYTDWYLFESANVEELSSSAKIEVMLKLAVLDLRKGTELAEMFFRCCWFFPKKEALQKLIELAKQSETEKVVKSVLEFQNRQGSTCLIQLFQMANEHKNRTGKDSSGSMLLDMGESGVYLIDLAKGFNLDLKKILNHTTKNGQTLFSTASNYSKTLTRRLLEENVHVNSVDHKFMTPSFKVRLFLKMAKYNILFSLKRNK